MTVVEVGGVIGGVLGGLATIWVAVAGFIKSNKNEKRLIEKDEDYQRTKIAAGSITGWQQLTTQMQTEMNRYAEEVIEHRKEIRLSQERYIKCEEDKRKQDIVILQLTNQLNTLESRLIK